MVQDVQITVSFNEQNDYICISDMAKAKSGESRAADVIKNWLRNRITLEFLGTWEQIYNPDFKVVEFDHFRSEAGLHTFVLSVSEWVEKTNAIGMFVKKGRYGGTFEVDDMSKNRAFDSIMAGLTEAVADAKSNKPLLKRNTVTIAPVKAYSAEEVKQIRHSTGMSQGVFAGYMGVSVKTVEAWETGTNQPSGAASRLLNMMEMDKDLIVRFPFVTDTSEM